MTGNDIDSRRQRYFRLNSAITGIDDRELGSRFGAVGLTNGWGRDQVIEVDGEKVFVKRIPLTDLEHENPFSTRNLYSLPTFYNYAWARPALRHAPAASLGTGRSKSADDTSLVRREGTAADLKELLNVFRDVGLRLAKVGEAKDQPACPRFLTRL